MNSTSNSYPGNSSRRSSPRRRKKQQSSCLFLLLGAFISFICVGITGFALYRAGFVPFGLSSSLTATAIARNNASCQALIDLAIQASGNYCSDTDSNRVCYGNTTIQAELVPNSTDRFSQRGDIIPVNELRRLIASPLDLDTNEWGIAVFKVIANLPRSLPGETVTMVVFGNATLDNETGNLESFYFSSELGQIACEKVPYDGLLVSSPDGGGIRFNINGAELTLMGNASIKAIKNGRMEVALYKGSARIVAEGEEQYFGAGQKVNVELGGENGNQATSGPSDPEPLSQDELDAACTLTGQYCSQTEVTPVSEEEAEGQIQGQVTSTPTLVPTQTLTGIPTITFEPTSTLLVLPSPTLSPAPTRTPNPPTATKIPPTRTNTPIPTLTRTPTNTSSPTLPPSAPTEPLCGFVSASALQSPSTNELAMDITNNSGSTITITRFFSYWVKTPQSQKLDRLLLDLDLIWNTSDSDSPTDIPSEGNWRAGADHTIPDGVTKTLIAQFQDDLQPSGYEVHVVFNIACQVIGTK